MKGRSISLIMWGGLHYLPKIDGKLVANSKGCGSMGGAGYIETRACDQGKRWRNPKKEKRKPSRSY